jgi:hypothetical protein
MADWPWLTSAGRLRQPDILGFIASRQTSLIAPRLAGGKIYGRP